MKKALNVILTVLIIGIVAVGVLLTMKLTKKAANKYENTKVVLYEGPKSLRDATEEDLVSTNENSRDISLLHCTDTKVTVNGEDCYVYDTNVNNSRSWSNNYLPALARTPVTYFDFEGEVEIQVTVPDRDLNSVKISPLSYGIEPVIDQENKTVTFSITEPDTYTLQFDDSPARALHIFANALEDPETLPDFDDENVIYIGPGEWTIDSISLEAGQTLYIAGGAVVHTDITANFVSNVRVCGRGIVDGSQYAGWMGTKAYVPLKFDYANNSTIEGIIVLNSNAWCLQGYSTDGLTIDDVKIISARPNGDGISIQSCTNVNVSNCFVRTWDDSLVVKNYTTSSDNINFKNIQVWTDLAQSMEVGYETNKACKEGETLTNVTFEDITVLNNFHKPIISVHNADDAAVSNITFRNITVENARVGSGDSDLPYLFDIAIVQSTNWSHTKERGTIDNVLIENVNIIGGEFAESRIQGYDADHKVTNVTFRNVNVLGTKIDSLETGKFTTKDGTTENIVFE